VGVLAPKIERNLWIFVKGTLFLTFFVPFDGEPKCQERPLPACPARLRPRSATRLPLFLPFPTKYLHTHTHTYVLLNRNDCLFKPSIALPQQNHIRNNQQQYLQQPWRRFISLFAAVL
jgi:hypothetical protein